MELKSIKNIKVGKVSFQLYEKDILILDFKKNTTFKLDEVISFIELGKEFIEFKKVKVISDFRGSSKIFDDESKEFIANDEAFNALKISDAFVIDSYISSILVGIYLRIFPPKTKTNIYSNLDDAVEWSIKQ